MTTLVDAPTRVDGVQLIGEMVGSGYRTPPALVRRADGQVLQLTPLLYLVLNAVDGRRSCAQVAELVARATGRGVSEADVRTLVDGQLRPLALVQMADGSAPETKRTDPLLALKPKIAITNQRTTHLLTDPFRVLFFPAIAALVVAGFVAVVAWVFFERGLAASAYDAFDRPHLLLLVFAVTVLSGGFHEFGHAAAARYSGAEPGVMGAGLYIVWPAFYTDVTDSYRLGRAGRIRTDLGGLYFNAIVVCLTFAWWWWTGWEALLLLVATQVLQMTQQLLPLLRFDGYHLLADIAGVPDLYQRIKPTLLGLLPHRWKSPENAMLKPSARGVITLWVLVTVPMMILMLLALIGAAPRLLGTAGSVIRKDAEAVRAAWTSSDVLDVAAHSLQVLGVVLPVLATVVILGRIGLQWFRGLARWSHGSAVKRASAAALSALLVTGLAWAWWPYPGNYRPISPDESGLFTSLMSGQTAGRAAAAGAARAPTGMLAQPGDQPIGTAARARLSSGEPLVATLEEGAPLPTKDEPMLAMVLVPVEDGARDPLPTATTDVTPREPTESPATPTSPTPTSPTPTAPTPTETTAPTDDTWVFPFDQPLAPEEGDNQALAVNTTDGSATYDLAFALVWAEGNEVWNVNEAHAYASCTDCVAVAVAFQVVLIMDDAQVVVPQNLAVAANYECLRCITAAIASQLVLSVQETPGEEELRALADVWNRLLQFGQNINAYTLTEIADQLDEFKQEILDILDAAPVVTPSPTGSTSSTADDPSSTTSSPSSTTTSPSGTSTSSTTTPTDTTTSPSPSPSSTTTSPTPTTTSPSPSSTTTSPSPSSTTTSPSPTSTTTSPSPTTTSSSPSPTTTSPIPTESPTATPTQTASSTSTTSPSESPTSSPAESPPATSGSTSTSPSP